MDRNICFGIGVEVLLLLLAVFGQSLAPLLLMLALPLCSGLSLLLGFLFRKHLSAAVALQDVAEPGRELKGSLTVTNTAPIGFPVLRAVTESMNLLTGESVIDELPVALGSKTSTSCAFSVNATHCGRVRLTVERLRVYDMFGFVSFSVAMNAKTKSLVLPEMFPMDVTVAKNSVIEPECDTFSPYKAGNDPSETFGIRDYEPGDALRSIHWKLTGKFDRLVIREASLPVNESVLILFERICPPRSNLASAAVRCALGEIAVSLSRELTERNIAHTMGWLRAENGTFLGHRVDSEESFQIIMAELLSVYEMHGEENTIESYLKTNDVNTYSNIVYISAHPAENLSLLPDLAKKTTILCSEKGNLGADGDFYAATPADYAVSLYQVLI